MKIIIIPSLENCDYYPGQKCSLTIWKYCKYSCMNQVVAMRVSILQYKANPVCESVTVKMGGQQGPRCSLPAGPGEPLFLAKK